ncbi:MAG: DUF975 family protein [Clostridia bacterium]|nr:DUF975 family protein [Clostridia bacterium]
MKYSADFKQIALDALKSKWLIATLTHFVASLLGGTVITTSTNIVSSNIDSDSLPAIISSIESEETSAIILLFMIVASLIVLLYCIAIFIISGPVRLGYAQFNLNLIDKNTPRFTDLFSKFKHFGSGFCMNFLTGLYISLWSLLFIIPGIIKTYSYAMTPYILAENPELTANEAITKSRQIMNGNKWRLFCLHFSFIGWHFLLALPIILIVLFGLLLMAISEVLGAFAFIVLSLLYLAFLFVGTLAINTYQEAANAAFYREVSYVPVYVPRELD